MIYCQDCGAANDVAGTFCRICGRNLSPERGSLLCPTCSQPLVNQAAFCSSCGGAVMQAPAAQPAHNFAFASAAADGGGTPPSLAPLNPVVQVINESLDLPDWLKRAATEQPQDSSQATDGSFMYTGVNPTPLPPPKPAPQVAYSPQLTGDPSVQQSPGTQSQPGAPWPAQAAPPQGPTSWPQAEPATVPSAPSAPGNSLWPSQVKPTMISPASTSPEIQAPASPGPARKLVSAEIPNGGLDQSMPSWLNQSPQAAAPVAPPTPAVPTEAMTDTTSFISESDLPAWIRQLAEAEEQRKAQETATAAAAAVAAARYQPAPPQAAPTSQDLFGEGSLAHRISQLPGEAEPPQVTSNPWLSRRDEMSGLDAAQADVWSRPKSDSDRGLGEREPEFQSSFAPSTALQPDLPITAQESAPVEKSDDAKLRLALLIAAAISVAALAAYLFMTGGL
jgi:Double zinc ribbon